MTFIPWQACSKYRKNGGRILKIVARCSLTALKKLGSGYEASLDFQAEFSLLILNRSIGEKMVWAVAGMICSIVQVRGTL